MMAPKEGMGFTFSGTVDINFFIFFDELYWERDF